MFVFFNLFRYPTEDSIDPFELFICLYNPDHKINSKKWRSHIQQCRKVNI